MVESRDETGTKSNDTHNMNNNKVFTISNKNISLIGDSIGGAEKQKSSKTKSEGVDFETAIAATGFGCFNILLMLIDIPSAWAAQFATTSMSYVFPVAQCDLNLSLNDKGLLNAIVYLGMISSAVIWGYLADTLGRKKLLVVGYLLDACFVFLCSISQSFTTLLVAKFMSGFIINGPFAVLVSFLSEFHSAKYRARILMMQGLFFGIANVLIPLLAWGVIPQPINFSIGSLEIHSWGVFLAICALPSLIAGFGHSWMPESPKFLMTTGKNDKALQVFQKVYSLNSHKTPTSYPVKSLVDEIAIHDKQGYKHGGHVTANRSKIQALKEGLQQIKPLFFPPHLPRLALVLTINFLTMMGLNTLRLWLPQLFTMMNDYQMSHNLSDVGICTVVGNFNNELETANNFSRKIDTNPNCVVNYSSDAVYINALIVGGFTMSAYVLTATVINLLGKKKVLLIFLTVSGSCSIAMYWATTTMTIVILSALMVALSSVCTNILLTVAVDLFPTHLRTISVSLSMMIGRTGAMSGNLIFPILLSKTGCIGPFFLIGGGVLVAGLLSIFIPNTDMKALE